MLRSSQCWWLNAVLLKASKLKVDNDLLEFFHHIQTSQYMCLCVFSEAILALQSEVSRLKKDLEEGLVQLPHLAQRMDYLSSKYSQDQQERRSKSRPHSRHRTACGR